MSEIIYGKNTVKEALRAGRMIDEVFIANDDPELISLCTSKKVKYSKVKKQEINAMTPNNHQGVVAVISEYHYYKLQELISEDKNALIVVLDCLEDPHNLGAIIRTAEAAGVDGIIIPKNRSVKLNQTVAKVSTGAIEHVKVCEVVNIRNTLQELKEKGYWVVGAERDEKSIRYDQQKYDSKTVLVIGSEGHGISRIVKSECDFLVEIPMFGKINSLNASVSAGILIYEIRRQQQTNDGIQR